MAAVRVYTNDRKWHDFESTDDLGADSLTGETFTLRGVNGHFGVFRAADVTAIIIGG